MHRHLFLSVLFLLPLFSFSQRDTASWDRTMEGVHKRSLCVVDTLINVYRQKELVIEDSVNWNYDFVEGTKTYLEIKIRTTVCSCMDCSYADHILVDITNLEGKEDLEISSANAVWIIWNSMMIATAESTFSGVLHYNDPAHFSFEIFKYVPGHSWLTYDGIRVDR